MEKKQEVAMTYLDLVREENILRGDVSGLRGDVSGLSGNVSGLSGNVSGLGNIP
jgi:hypothetical protein